MISSLDQKSKVINKSIVDLKKRSVQAAADKIELVRDLATYEVNMGTHLSLRQRLLDLTAYVNSKKEDFRNRELDFEIDEQDEMMISIQNPSVTSLDADWNKQWIKDS